MSFSMHQATKPCQVSQPRSAGWSELGWVWQVSCSHHPHLHTPIGALFLLSSPPRPTHRGSWARRGICISAVQRKAGSSRAGSGAGALFWLACGERDAPALSSHLESSCCHTRQCLAFLFSLQMSRILCWHLKELGAARQMGAKASRNPPSQLFQYHAGSMAT